MSNVLRKLKRAWCTKNGKAFKPKYTGPNKTQPKSVPRAFGQPLNQDLLLTSSLLVAGMYAMKKQQKQQNKGG